MAVEVKTIEEKKALQVVQEVVEETGKTCEGHTEEIHKDTTPN